MSTIPTLDLGGRRALVTGASRGIGAVVARTLAQAGAQVLIGYRADEDSASRTLEAIETAGGKGTLLQANLQRPEEIRQLFESVKAGGGLDILVHAAALGSFKPVLDVRPNQWDLTMAVGPRALLLCAREAAALMDGRSGRIVGLSSLGGMRVVPSYGAIGVSKAASDAVVRYLAVELAPRGIRVNGVAAGIIADTSLERHADYARLAAHALDRTPAQRLGTPEDVARVVLFLCSPLADWIVGQTIVADGGLSLPV